MTARVVMAVAAVAAMAWLAVGASAAPPHDGCPVGPGGNGTTGINAWLLMDESALDAAMQAAAAGRTQQGPSSPRTTGTVTPTCACSGRYFQTTRRASRRSS